MHSLFRSSYGVGFAMWMALAGCGQKADEGARATREECQQMAEHAAELILDTARTHPNEFWELLHQSAGETGLPQDLTKEKFESWLDTDQGRTWMMKRRGQTLAGTQRAVEPCVANATKRDIKCMLAAKSKDELAACDDARNGVPRGSAGSGSAASGSAGSGSAGSGSAEAGSAEAGSAAAGSAAKAAREGSGSAP